MNQQQTGEVVDQETKVRTMFMTYEATDEVAEVFMVVLGAVAENFRGITIAEFKDDTVFADGDTPMDVLHDLATAEERLTPDQRAALAAFGEALAEWDGGESP